MVYQDATGFYHFLINVIPFISNSIPPVVVTPVVHQKHTLKVTSDMMDRVTWRIVFTEY